MEDWGATATAPVFTLFKKISPQEAAKQDQFVDIIIYNRWSKAERRLYQRLKTEQISRRMEERRMQTIDDLSLCLDSLNFMKEADETDPLVDDLIEKLNKMKCDSSLKPESKNDAKTSGH